MPYSPSYHPYLSDSETKTSSTSLQA